MTQSSKKELGSVTVLAAAVLFLCGVLSLVSVDLMRAIEARGRAQTAADAAALAAARELVLPSDSTPAAAAAEYATRNGGVLLSCRCDPGTFEAVVEVEVEVAMIFLGDDRHVAAAARAVVEGEFLRPDPAR